MVCVLWWVLSLRVFVSRPRPFGLRAELKWRSRTDKRDPRTDVHTGTE